jgi:hypothetical protein
MITPVDALNVKNVNVEDPNIAIAVSEVVNDGSKSFIWATYVCPETYTYLAYFTAPPLEICAMYGVSAVMILLSNVLSFVLPPIKKSPMDVYETSRAYILVSPPFPPNTKGTGVG